MVTKVEQAMVPVAPLTPTLKLRHSQTHLLHDLLPADVVKSVSEVKLKQHGIVGVAGPCCPVPRGVHDGLRAKWDGHADLERVKIICRRSLARMAQGLCDQPAKDLPHRYWAEAARALLGREQLTASEVSRNRLVDCFHDGVRADAVCHSATD